MDQGIARGLADEWARRVRPSRREGGRDWTGRAEQAETYALVLQLRDFVPDEAPAQVMVSDTNGVVVVAVSHEAVHVVSATSETVGADAHGRGTCTRVPLDPRTVRLTASTETRNGFSGTYQETSWTLDVSDEHLRFVSDNQEAGGTSAFARALAAKVGWDLPESAGG